uniref:Uncharacterized protein n=1 Tax=Tanacetum cinerariifolium TaxID=118510 RepID=A0A6L2KX57_TANCI|nr:hypothetical protein [Tanacetum cinerariifolium]
MSNIGRLRVRTSSRTILALHIAIHLCRALVPIFCCEPIWGCYTSEGTGVKPGVLDVSKEDFSNSDDDSWGDSEDEKSEQTNLDDYENPSFTLKDIKEEEQYEEYVLTLERDKSDDEDKMYEEEDDDIAKKLYGDLNITQGLRDIDMTNAEHGREDQQNASHESGFMQEEDAHVTLTTVHDKTKGPLQSYSISSKFTSKLLNLDDLSSDINSLMNTSTVPPPPPPVDPSSHLTIIPQQQTPDSTTKTSYQLMTLLEIPNFASLFQFDQRVSTLETKVSEFYQTSQFVEAISSIPGIVDNYLASKLKEEVNAAVRLQSNKLKEEAKAKNQEFINQVDLTMKKIIKEQMSYAVATSLSEFELKKILINKMETNESINRSEIQRNLYNALVKSYNTGNDILSTYGDVVTLKRGRDDQDKDKDPSARSDRGRKRRKLRKDVEPSKDSKSKESKSSISSKGTQSHPKSSGRST